jgi:hypothetical protein
LNISRIGLGRLTSYPDARNQDVDETFGGPLAIASQANVRNPGKRAHQVERIKVQTNVAARDRAIDQLRNCLCFTCAVDAEYRSDVPPTIELSTSDIPCLVAM